MSTLLEREEDGKNDWCDRFIHNHYNELQGRYMTQAPMTCHTEEAFLDWAFQEAQEAFEAEANRLEEQYGDIGKEVRECQ